MVNESDLFYKYQAINERTLENLTKNQFHFSYPYEFNDPFDSKYNIVWRGPEKLWIQFFNRYGITDLLEIKRIIRDMIKRRVFRRRTYDILLDPTREAYQELSNEVHGKISDIYPRICCFTKNNSSILMWSHYSEKHEGICLSFKSGKKGNANYLMLDSEECVLLPITYEEDIPPMVNLLDQYNYDDLAALLITKYSDWGYEDEYRIILWKDEIDNKKNINYRKEDLEGIIFGLKTKFNKAKDVVSVVNEHYIKVGFDVNFYRCIEENKKYALKIKKIDNIDSYLRNLEEKEA